MLTVILNVTSKSADLKQYAGFLNDGDSLITIDNNEDKNIVKQYNAIVDSTDKASDILLLSDSIKLHDGFIKNMDSCLYAAEKHAIVYGQEIEDNKSLIETAGTYLPEYTITIQANAHCALIKRTVINTLGFLDETYNSLQYALMDYYCRSNIYGYSSVISHHALFTYNAGKQETGDSADWELFESKYEYWDEKKQRFDRQGTHPCVEFLTLIDNRYYHKKRILFDCIIMPAMHCGTTEYQISVFEAFSRIFKDKYDIYMYTTHEADEYHKISSKFANILYPDTISGTFHLGFAPNQLMFYETQSEMNKRCLKIVQTMFDIMVVRIDEHTPVDLNSDVELGVRFSDGIVFISNYTANDFKACFANEIKPDDMMFKVIYPATEINTQVKNKYDLPFKEYFLVVGNAFKHKAVRETVDIISGTQHNFIVIGYGDNEYMYPNVYSYMSGHIDGDFLSYLYANCKAVIFPSLYEGFGLPVVISFKNRKRVIVNNNALNNELLGHFGQFKDYFLFFDDFEQIRDIIDNTNFTSELSQIEYNDTWDRVAIELESFFEQILETEVDIERLNERWYLYKLIETKMINTELRFEPQITKLESLHLQFGEYKLLTLLRFALKEYVKNRHPGLYKFLKRKQSNNIKM